MLGRRQQLCIGICTAALLIPTQAQAHKVGLSRGQYTLDDDSITAEISVSLRDARTLARQLDGNRDGTLDHEEARAGSDEITHRLTTGIVWREGPDRCPPSNPRLVPAGDDGLTLFVRYTCPRPLSPALHVDIRELLTGTDAGHRHILAVTRPNGRVTLFGGNRTNYLFQPVRGDSNDVDTFTTKTNSPTTSYVQEGVRHVLAGWDHLLFICGLVLIFVAGDPSDRRARFLVGWVSGFTVGHCLSLMLATVVGWQADPGWVEPLIALSLAHLGWVTTRRSRPGWSLLAILIGFGLVHGLGFAGALAALGISGVAGLGPLFLFNLGVEAGQLVILAGMLGACHLVFKMWPHARRPALTAAAWGMVATGLTAAAIRLLPG